MKKALVFGGGGFIGSHLVRRLKKEGFWVRSVDLKLPDHWETAADDFIVGDIRDKNTCNLAFDTQFDEVYQLAADMGGAGYLFTGENDSDVMHNSSLINLNVLSSFISRNQKARLFYSSSACVYPEYNQLDPQNPNCREDTAYPAEPDSEYGWEKLFSERIYLAFARNYSINVRIGRYHNIYGPYGTWNGGKEKVPAAICRKVAETKNKRIDVWGDGTQTRSFLFIEDCIDATIKLTRSDFQGPVNIGSEEMVSINQLVQIVSSKAQKDISINHISGPLGVMGRNSDNRLIWEKLKWKPGYILSQGISETYDWISEQVKGLPA